MPVRGPLGDSMRAVVKWSLRLLLALAVLAVFYVAPLVFPSPLFAHQARSVLTSTHVGEGGNHE